MWHRGRGVFQCAAFAVRWEQQVLRARRSLSDFNPFAAPKALGKLLEREVAELNRDRSNVRLREHDSVAVFLRSDRLQPGAQQTVGVFAFRAAGSAFVNTQTSMPSLPRRSASSSSKAPAICSACTQAAAKAGSWLRQQ